MRNDEEELFYLNHHDTVKYVGMQTCRSCHEDKHSTFIHTGMGLSFEGANRKKSAASFEHDPVYDKYRDFYYKPFWENDSLMILEFRLQNGDTVFQRKEKISYIIGSGQHTNSHLVNFNSYIYQAPVTWYAQKKLWDLPPGFENGSNTRFSRLIGMECMSCHNALPEFDKGSVNRFITVPGGIDCERCHGPGELHVQEKLKGNIVDTAKEIDRTIVNPKKLHWQQQVDLCQRCHLQGNAVLKEGKDFSMFRPGMRLKDFWDVYMPLYDDDNGSFIMAAHAQRFQKSKCFLKSNASENSRDLKFTCITCHNPHVSVKFTGKQVFNDACMNCHSNTQWEVYHPSLQSKNFDCISCHMPSSGTEDIPHVTVHDHYIRKPSDIATRNSAKNSFKGLYPVNNPDADYISAAKAYLQWFDKFGNYELRFLDSAKKYLDFCGDAVKEWVYYFHLKKDVASVIAYASRYRGDDAWTNYYIAAAYKQKADAATACVYYKKALEKLPAHPDFKVEYASALFLSGKISDAETMLKEVLSKQPKHVQALSNLAVIYFNRREFFLARKYADAALQLDPDEVNALICNAEILIQDKRKSDAEKLLQRALKIQPENKKVRETLQLLTRK